MLIWQFIPDVIPVNGQFVWTRLYNGYANPFIAVYNSIAQTFTFVANGVVYPIWMVAKWAPAPTPPPLPGIGSMIIGSSFTIA